MTLADISLPLGEGGNFHLYRHLLGLEEKKYYEMQFCYGFSSYYAYFKIRKYHQYLFKLLLFFKHPNLSVWKGGSLVFHFSLEIYYDTLDPGA
jgi:hypothetical protein